MLLAAMLVTYNLHGTWTHGAAMLQVAATAVNGYSPPAAGRPRAAVRRIHMEVTKVVVRDLFTGCDNDEGAAACLRGFELDRWRFRLAPCACD
jgi:hypothetical protein